MANPILAKIAGAKVSQSGALIRDGRYTYSVLGVMIEQKRKGTMAIIELLVEECEPVETGVIPNSKGSTCGYVVNLDTNDSAAGNVKSFVLALYGENPDEVSEDDLMTVLGDLIAKEQPARGMKIADVTYRRPIKTGPNMGKMFVGHNWTEVKMTEAEIKENRKRLDALAHKKPAA